MPTTENDLRTFRKTLLSQDDLYALSKIILSGFLYVTSDTMAWHG